MADWYAQLNRRAEGPPCNVRGRCRGVCPMCGPAGAAACSRDLSWGTPRRLAASTWIHPCGFPPHEAIVAHAPAAAAAFRARTSAMVPSRPQIRLRRARAARCSRAGGRGGRPRAWVDADVERVRVRAARALGRELGDLSFARAASLVLALQERGSRAGSGPSLDLGAVVCVCGRWLVVCRAAYDSSIVVASSSRWRARRRRA
jgi:hypothetical protein